VEHVRLDSEAEGERWVLRELRIAALAVNPDLVS
jgi:hypothetical protein